MLMLELILHIKVPHINKIPHQIQLSKWPILFIFLNAKIKHSTPDTPITLGAEFGAITIQIKLHAIPKSVGLLPYDITKHLQRWAMLYAENMQSKNLSV